MRVVPRGDGSERIEAAELVVVLGVELVEVVLVPHAEDEAGAVALGVGVEVLVALAGLVALGAAMTAAFSLESRLYSLEEVAREWKALSYEFTLTHPSENDLSDPSHDDIVWLATHRSRAHDLTLSLWRSP